MRRYGPSGWSRLLQNHDTIETIFILGRGGKACALVLDQTGGYYQVYAPIGTLLRCSEYTNIDDSYLNFLPPNLVGDPRSWFGFYPSFTKVKSGRTGPSPVYWWLVYSICLSFTGGSWSHHHYAFFYSFDTRYTVCSVQYYLCTK